MPKAPVWYDSDAVVLRTKLAGILTLLSIPDASLSSNVPLKNGTNAFTGSNSFATNALDLLVGQIKFPSSQNASGDVNTLDDYEEGTWTPSDVSGAGLTLTTYGSPHYVKIGKMVAFSCNISYPATADGSNARIGGLPFVSAASQYAVPPGLNTTGINGGCFVESGLSYAQCYNVGNGAVLTNAQMSGAFWYFSGTYLASS